MFTQGKPTKKAPGKERKKQKSRVSQEYRKNEQHVQQLLQQAGLSVGDARVDNAEPTPAANGNGPQRETKHGDDELSQSVQFFCKMWNDGEKLPKQAHGKRMLFDPWNSSSEDEHNRRRSRDGSEANKSPSEGSELGTASTYIQIDALDLEVIQPLAPVKMVAHNEDLYKPCENLPPKLAKRTEGMSHETLRLVNRFYTEANQTGNKVPKTIVNQLREADAKAKGSTAAMGAQRVRSNCGHKFHPVFCEPSPNAASVPPRRFVRIYMKDLVFSRHPQLLEEHSIANQLDELCVEYGKRLTGRVCEQIEADLQTERKIVNQLLAQATGQQGASRSVQRLPPHQLEGHLMAVKGLRNRLHREEATNKRLLGDILNMWVRLKAVRRTQEFQCTRLRLKIKVDESADVIVRSQRWSQRYETELNEIYRERLEEYYRMKRQWKRTRGNRPAKPDIIELAEQLKRELTEFSYLPTEPKVDIHLCRLSDEEFYELTPGAAKKVRSYFMRIYFDQSFVGETKSYRVEPDMRVAFNEAIGIFLERRMPKKIRFTLFEKTKLAKAKKIGILNVPVNKETPLGGGKRNFAIQTLEFDRKNCTTLFEQYDGKLSVKIHFEREFFCPTLVTADLFPPIEADTNNNNNGQTASNRTFTVRGDLGTTLLDTSGGDGDSRAVSATDTDDDGDGDNVSLKSDATLTPDTPKTTCTFEEEQLQFCDVHQLSDNRRLKLLQSRYAQSDSRTKALKLIPALENEVIGTVDGGDGDGDNGSTDQVIVLGTWMDRIDVYKHEGKKYIRVLYEAIKTQCRRMNKMKRKSDDLLIGDDPSQWSSFFEALGWKFPKKPTRPTSVGVGADLSTKSNDFKVMLNVVRATGIPVRDAYVPDEGQTLNNSEANMFLNQSIKYSNVKPFVGFGYRDKFTRSITAEGSNPTWNEQLQLTLSGTLSELHHDLTITLYDEVVEHHVNDDPAIRNADVYQRIQLNCLGECRIPISALIQRKKIDGVFELTMPKILIGYKSAALDTLASSTTANPNDATLLIDHEIKENIYMWFYLSIEPAFELPSIETNCLECAELRDVRLQLDLWSLQVKQVQPARFIEPLVCSSQGKRVCLTRLLGAIPLPVEVSENLLESACRFVSLLHVLENYDECMGFGGVWLNNQVLLDCTACSAKDLGVLLCNYMLSIGMRCWLVLGIGQPFGEMTFVLYRNDDDDLYLIDPHSGKHYSTRDTFCTLQQVYYVVATDNIYCNMQREQRVSMTNFNLKDSACWLAAFSKKSPAPLGGVQKLNYVYTPSYDVNDLKCTIERKIRKKIAAWRTMRKTTWNRAFNTRMQHVLQDLEERVTFAGSNAGRLTNVSHQLSAEFPNYTMYGYTLNFAYTRLSSVAELIKSTGIHGNSDKSVEFAVAVHMKAYANNVLSVWVFLMAVAPLPQ